jgi:hypothetical protein
MRDHAGDDAFGGYGDGATQKIKKTLVKVFFGSMKQIIFKYSYCWYEYNTQSSHWSRDCRGSFAGGLAADRYEEEKDERVSRPNCSRPQQIPPKEASNLPGRI